MKQVAVISGKGGTGKTSITASFAALARESIIVDADVDASDLHLLLHPKIKNREKFFAGDVARINPKLCDRGKRCEPYCRYGALVLDDGDDFRIDPTACEGCGVCARICHTGAIIMEPRDCGEWYLSSTAYGPMVHARLGTGGENSGKLVSLLRQKAKELADGDGHNLVLVDGPPGIGCPVMATITGVDLLVCVSEPTVSGKHDLSRILDLADHFRIPLVMIINKYDINPEISSEIKETCHHRQVEVIAEIPYDPEVAGAIVHGETLVDYSDGPAVKAVGKGWDRLREILKKKDTR